MRVSSKRGLTAAYSFLPVRDTHCKKGVRRVLRRERIVAQDSFFSLYWEKRIMWVLLYRVGPGWPLYGMCLESQYEGDAWDEAIAWLRLNSKNDAAEVRVVRRGGW